MSVVAAFVTCKETRGMSVSYCKLPFIVLKPLTCAKRDFPYIARLCSMGYFS